MCRNLYFVNGTKLHEKRAANESFSALQSRWAKKSIVILHNTTICMHKKKRPRKAVSFPEMKYNYEKKKKCGEIVVFLAACPDYSSGATAYSI
jgi:hypothetical protein